MCSLQHFANLRTILEILEKPCPSSILQQVNTHTQDLIQNVVQKSKTSPRYESFQPSHEKRIKQLLEFNSEHVFLQEIKQYTGVCESALDAIEILKNNVLNGKRKRQITSQWLRQIDNTVNCFLVKL